MEGKVIDTLKHADREIKSLRKQNELMAARLGVFDSMVSLLNARVDYRGEGISPDVCLEIDKLLTVNPVMEQDNEVKHD